MTLATIFVKLFGVTQVHIDTGVLADAERMLINGELQYTSSGATFDVIHPATEQAAGQATDGTVADMHQAIGAARRAFDESAWSRDVEFRHHCLMQLHSALEAEKERLRRVLVTEVGCPVTVTGSQIEDPIGEVKHWAEHTDIPAGVFNVVVSNANEVGAALAADPRVDMITFTGSTATGRAILAAGATTVQKTLLELGGKSAHIVLADADFGSALPIAAMMACVMSGQSCILTSRILLPRSRYDEGITILKGAMENFPVGDPWTPGIMQGPQISATQRDKVLGLISSGIDSGARLVTGGGVPEHLPTGYYVAPTLLADVDPDARVAQEEIFGPVLTVTCGGYYHHELVRTPDGWRSRSLLEENVWFTNHP